MQLLNKEFLTHLQRLADGAPHAVLIEGVRGRRALYEAELFANLLKQPGGTIRRLEKPGDKQVIGIEQVQKLYRETRSKRPTGKDIWIIDGAEQMSEPAQNAFLKLLEEPPENTTFILAVRNSQEVLQTVSSRCKVIRCKPVAPVTAQKWLNEAGISPARVQQLIFLSEGSADELTRLVNDAEYSEARLKAAADAKLLVSGAIFDRISLVSQLANDRPRALDTVAIALQMLGLLSPGQADQPKFLRQLESLTGAYGQLRQNGNIRLQLLRAALSA